MVAIGFLAALALAPAGLVASGAELASAGPAGQIRVTLLGTGTPQPSATQFGASTLVEAGGTALLFDCGRGCGIRLMQARPALYNKLDRVFLTHLHSDHVVGLPDLWLNGWTQNRVTPFRVWGPVGTDGLMAGLRQAFSWDVHIRLDVEKVPATGTGLEPIVTEITAPGVVYDSRGVRVTAFVDDHADAKPAFGYRIDYAGHAVVLSGDTRLTPELIRQTRGVDLLVQEVAPPALVEYLERNYTAAQAAAIVAHHTTIGEIASLAGKNRPRLLVYSHYSKSPDSDRRLASETARVWNGPFELGEDLMTITVGDNVDVCRPTGGCRTNSDR